MCEPQAPNPLDSNLVFGRIDEQQRPIALATLTNFGPVPMIFNLMVDRQHEREGLASSLIREMSAKAQELGHDNIYAIIHPDSADVRQLFEDEGFKEMILVARDC